jgi:hypothetical protein
LLKDATQLRKNRHAYFWERTVALLFSICQVGLSIAGIVAIAIAFTADTEPYWLDAVILCTLQLFIGANVSIIPNRIGLRTHTAGSLPGHSVVLTSARPCGYPTVVSSGPHPILPSVCGTRPSLPLLSRSHSRQGQLCLRVHTALSRCHSVHCAVSTVVHGSTNPRLLRAEQPRI